MESKHTTEKEESFAIDGVKLKLSRVYSDRTPWIGGEIAVRQLRAAWLKLSDQDIPMNPRIVGKPGVGKTTLAIHVAQSLNLPAFVMQATSDTRPEDLIITPVISEKQSIVYVASPLVSAMVRGGVCILDEGNRMSEKSWASLAALLDQRRYVDSVVAGVRIKAHPNFRFVTTMNDDASVFDLPEYIQSRLSPQIYIDFPDADTEARIIKLAVPYVDTQILSILVGLLENAHTHDQHYSARDGIQIAKYAMRLLSDQKEPNISEALLEAVQMVVGEDALRFLPVTRTDGTDDRKLKPV